MGALLLLWLAGCPLCVCFYSALRVQLVALLGALCCPPGTAEPFSLSLCLTPWKLLRCRTVLFGCHNK